MQKIDAATVAETFAYCEAHADSDDEAALITWMAEHVADAIKRQHPRFNTGEFQVRALPIKTRERREAILVKLADRG